MEISLQGLRVVITGGATGLGRAIGNAFLENDARVHICDVDEPAIDEFRRMWPEAGGTQADVAVAEEVDSLFDEARASLGGLDVLVNNAGIAGPTAHVEDIDPDEWHRTLTVNVDGQFLCARRAVPLLKSSGGGSLINIASTAGFLGYPLRSSYAASKWAVVGFTKSLAMELGEHAIRVNAVCPGPIEGERMERVIAAEAEARRLTTEQVRAGYLRQSSLGTFVDAQEIAETVLFLCSPSGAKITGQIFGVDGNTETLRTNW